MFTETIIKLQVLNQIAEYLAQMANSTHDDVVYNAQRMDEVKEEHPDDYQEYWQFLDRKSALEEAQQKERIIRAIIPQLEKLAK